MAILERAVNKNTTCNNESATFVFVKDEICQRQQQCNTTFAIYLHRIEYLSIVSTYLGTFYIA